MPKSINRDYYVENPDKLSHEDLMSFMIMDKYLQPTIHRAIGHTRGLAALVKKIKPVAIRQANHDVQRYEEMTVGECNFEILQSKMND